MLRALLEEFSPTIKLAGPLVMAELAWMTMGIVDTLMVGRLGPEAIGAVGVGSMLFLGVGVFGIGLLLGLDPLVSQAYGARRIDECHRWLAHGLWLGCFVSVPVMALLFAADGWLGAWGFHPDVLSLVRPYLEVVTWSMLPLLLYTSFRHYLQSIGIVTPIMVALLTANLVNVAVNWVLIFGNLGAPALGVTGAAWATVLSRIYMASMLLGVIAWREASQGSGLVHAISWPELARMRRLLRIGLPAAGQLLLEVGVFAAATALAGRLLPAALAAHQIVLHIAGFTFMVPLGVGTGGGVRVGHAIGRGDWPTARRAGWAALLIGGSFMAATAVAFVSIPGLIVRAFTPDMEVVRIGATLLLIAAVFQLFDGIQGVATGVLRGAGDTRRPMIWNLVAHWGVGLPLGYALCFVFGYGVPGLWIGLSIGLIIVAVVLLVCWAQYTEGRALRVMGMQ